MKENHNNDNHKPNFTSQFHNKLNRLPIKSVKEEDPIQELIDHIQFFLAKAKKANKKTKGVEILLKTNSNRSTEITNKSLFYSEEKNQIYEFNYYLNKLYINKYDSSNDEKNYFFNQISDFFNQKPENFELYLLG